MSSASSNAPAALLDLASVSKSFGETIALSEVSFEVGPGEIHALLGENGAGKSTLVKIIVGLETPDSGTVRWEGQPSARLDPRHAYRRGIGVVFQHFSLFESLSVEENLAMAIPSRLDRPAVAAALRDAALRWGLTLDPEARVNTLSAGERQRLEIVRCLTRAAIRPKLLILDEPTAVLTPDASEQLFVTLRRLRDAGTSILFISHKLAEVRKLCDRATILRRGRVVGEVRPAEETESTLARLMLGSLPRPVTKPAARTSPDQSAPMLSVKGLTVPSDPRGRNGLQDISFDLQAGDILGIAGVAGNGQNALLGVLSGEYNAPTPSSGSVLLQGQPVAGQSPAERRRRGLAYLPDDRLGRASAPTLSLSLNGLLTAAHCGLVTRGWVQYARVRAFAEKCIAELGVHAAGPDTAAGALSGGNLQKFLLARELCQTPSVLIAAQPTWGVDVGAAAEIHRRLISLAENGAAVLLVSEDLDELMTLSTRIAVMYRGTLSKPLNRASASVERIGTLMGGSSDAI